MSIRSGKICAHFDQFAPEYSKWRKRNNYYHREQKKYFRYLIGENKKVLELGCGAGDLLSALKPSAGIGIDISPKMINLAKTLHPNLNFIVGDAHNLEIMGDEYFDYVILSDIVGYLEDIQTCLERVRRFFRPHTRIIISYYNFLWEPTLRLGERLALKTPTPEQSWLSIEDLENLLFIADYQVVKTERRLLFPKYIPIISSVLNRIGALPYINKACLNHYVVARMLPRNQHEEMSTSIIIPCKNEKGNIEQAIKRMPKFGTHQEIIFVDGHSTDGTQEEIKRIISIYPDTNIKFIVQDGIGKGDAVRKGFQVAKEDILMILDADLTVPPEDLTKFYYAMATGKAEFINGSRLVYPLEGEAMRALNLLANKLFALIFSWLLGQRLKDTLCGTKVMLRDEYKNMADNRVYFGDFDPFGDFDLLFGASKLNLKIIEIPIRYRRRIYGETQISRFTHGLQLLKMVAYAFRKLKL